MKKVLEYVEKCSCRFLLSYALPLCIAEVDEDFLKWNMQNHVLCYFGFDRTLQMKAGMKDAMEYGPNERNISQWMNIRKLNHKEASCIKDIITYIKSNIDSGKYTILFSDEYYIGSVANHFLHERLYIGYDQEKEEFYTLAYDNYIFGVFAVRFSELRKSYHEIKNAGFDTYKMWDKYVIYTFEPYKKNLDYDPLIFKEKMRLYLNGNEIETDEEPGRFFFGVESLRGIAEYMKDLQKKQKLCESAKLVDLVKTLQLFIEQKRGLKKRIEYYGWVVGKDYKSEKEVLEYINKELTKTQRSMFKHYLKAKNMTAVNVGDELIKDCIEVNRLYHLEKETLFGMVL